MKIKTGLFNKMGEAEAYFLFEKESFPKEIKSLEKFAKQEKFKGKTGEVFSYNDGNKKIIILGLGPKKEFELETIRKSAAIAFQFANNKKARILTINAPKIEKVEDGIVAIGEAITLCDYDYDQFKSKKKDDEEKITVEEIQLKGEKSKKMEKALNEGIIKAKAQNYTRELQELPPNIATPALLAQRAKQLAKENKLSIYVMNKKELQKKKMNAILAVNRGSAQEPVMVVLEYNKGKKNLPFYAVVGKGITFDSGGISLKPSSGMEDMKYDKTGGCSALGIIKAVSELKLPIRLMVVVPFTENMPDGNSQRPSDIITAYNGKTIEVLNTDAEGRLILADALAYASEKKPKAIIDLATLTGAVVVCLGKHAIGLLSNDDSLAKTIEASGNYTYEKVWRLPLWKEYSEMIKSNIADIKNIGSDRGEAGTITAAAFLQEFVGKTKWAHLDIAAYDSRTGHPYFGTGAIGGGVRLVTDTLMRLSGVKK